MGISAVIVKFLISFQQQKKKKNKKNITESNQPEPANKNKRKKSKCWQQTSRAHCQGKETKGERTGAVFSSFHIGVDKLQ